MGEEEMEKLHFKMEGKSYILAPIRRLLMPYNINNSIIS